jgi:hypothetical protein
VNSHSFMLSYGSKVKMRPSVSSSKWCKVLLLTLFEVTMNKSLHSNLIEEGIVKEVKVPGASVRSNVKVVVNA